MAFDGNGNWVSDYYPEAGDRIEASVFRNEHLADLEQSFENCITRDGQGKPTTNFNANNYRVINVANPTQAKDAVNKQTMDSTLLSKVPVSVGSGTQPVYTDANGKITASTSTVGDSATPLYLKDGELTAITKSIYDMIIPDYANPITLTSGQATTKSGMAFFRYGGQGTYNVSVNGTNVINYSWGANYGSPDNACLIIGKGDVVTFNGGLVGFYPFKGQ